MISTVDHKDKPALSGGIIQYNNRLAPLLIRNTLHSIIPNGIEHIYVAGIGSNVISGDSVGPLVGTLLKNIYPGHLTVIGSLQSPLDAVTLGRENPNVPFHSNSFVIAVDSVLGKKEMVNSIIVRKGTLLPGIGLGNQLPSLGDCSIMGVVLENNPDLHSSLLYTNLDTIFTMAMNIAKGISIAVRQFFNYPPDEPVLLLR
ncbi:spore protease YyaC [Mesobacillus foraminis]|uniref:spore protease YyaC n=1 Tax=Mesobacillus foraminis TaxID=279826 RepID=UPI0039A1C871